MDHPHNATADKSAAAVPVIKTTKKTVLVVKKKRRRIGTRPANTAATLSSLSSSRRKLSLGLSKSNASVVKTTPLSNPGSVLVQSQQQESDRDQQQRQRQRQEEYFGEADPLQDAFLGNHAAMNMCDTFQLIQSLQQQQSADKCVSIPLYKSGQEFFLAVLECSLYNSGLVHSTVGRELTELLQSNQVRQLAPPSSSRNSFDHVPPPHVYCTFSDYCRAVQQVKTDPTAASPPQQAERDLAVDWFMENLPHWTGQKIAHADLEHVWNHPSQPSAPIHTNSSLTLETTLRHLVEHQVLLPCHAERAYQLWLPTWPWVLQAWTKKCTSVLAQLKRSPYKEKSLRSFQKSQAQCPVSIPLLMEYLVSLDKVELVQKPSGTFVKLVP